MPKRYWSMIAQRSLLGYVGLARGKICVRAVHHIFNPEKESEEAEDEDDPMPDIC
jgi:hypothetical protein